MAMHGHLTRWLVLTFAVVFVLVGLAAESGLVGAIAGAIVVAVIAAATRTRRPRASRHA